MNEQPTSPPAESFSAEKRKANADLQAIAGLLQKSEEREQLIQNKYKEIEKFREKLLGNDKDSARKTIDGLLGKVEEYKTNAEKLEKNITDFLKSVQKQKEEHEVKTKGLHQQIEGLLPRATSAGLAEAYKE